MNDINAYQGGLSAVIWTDFVQTIIMVISALILMIICCVKIGGIQAIKELYPYAIPDTTLYSNVTCGILPYDYFSLIRPLDSNNGPPWLGIFGMIILSIWYFCRSVLSRIVSRLNNGRLCYHVYFSDQVSYVSKTYLKYHGSRPLGHCSTYTCCEKFNSCSSRLHCCWLLEIFTSFSHDLTWNGCAYTISW